MNFSSWSVATIILSLIVFFFTVSLVQPGDLYIEKLLTHTIKAQSNIKLKVEESKEGENKMCLKIVPGFLFLHIIVGYFFH